MDSITVQKTGGNRKNKDEVHYYFIYMHINKINNKKYVGLTYQNPPEKRWRNGKAYPFKSNPYFYNDIEKFGWDNFENIIIEEGFMTVREGYEKENHYVNLYNTREREHGYNINAGGFYEVSPNASIAGVKWMKEHPEFGLERVSEMHTWQKENPDEMYKMRKINSAKATEARKKAVVCLELEEVFESASEAARHFPKLSQSKVTMCCQGQRKTAGGFHWLYLDEYSKIENIKDYLSIQGEKKQRSHKKAVICVETGEIFESVTQAAKEKNLSLYSIAECCRNKKLNNYTCGGYHWRFKE